MPWSSGTHAGDRTVLVVRGIDPGTGREPPPELQAQMEEMQQLSIGEPEFFDLKQPWLYAPH
jgi:hypothetical protein